MKVLFAVLLTVSTMTILRCQVLPNNDSGQYVHDNSGQYVHDDSGRYVHDPSGDYQHDGQGNYQNDNSGTYKADASAQYQNGGNLLRQNYYQQRQIGTTNPSNQLSSIHLLGAGSSVNAQIIKPGKPFSIEKSFGNAVSAATPARAVANVKYDSGRYVDGYWKILRQLEDFNTDKYHWEYETENGITAEESGQVANKGTDKEGMKAKGFYQYTGPDKALYSIGYTADENGFIPVGNHIPTPPPVPIEIQKSLDYLRSLGKL